MASDQEYVTAGGRHATGFHGLLGHLRGLKGPTGFGASSTAEQVAAGWEGKGKVVIVTGASTGLGLESARVLAARGATVVMAARDTDKMERNAAAIREATPSAQLHLLPLDLADLGSVERFAGAVKALRKPLHVLMLNAGIMAPPFSLSKDGYESQFATNHLGHFRLVQLLLPDVIATARLAGGGQEGRIVVLSSSAHFKSYPEGLRVVGLDSPIGYSPWGAYGQSKLCNVLFARALAERMRGQPVRVVCCHPGIINTELGRSLGIPAIAQAVLPPLLAPVMKSIPQGAATQVYCATSPDVVAGEFYSDVTLQPSHPLSHSRTLAEKLWAISEQMCAGTYGSEAPPPK